MPFFKSKPEPITYFFSSDNFHNTIITNQQTNEIYWIEKPSTSPTGPSYLSKSSATENSYASRTFIATIELQAWESRVAHITYNGTRKSIWTMFPKITLSDTW
ncbi:hypothetical protein DL93DRAFT_2080520 [Clavulina sp. PMI_390]|nr:hypothetical protein DL93DRAFT_2080520 [Clavulina sp. PMI_390]